MNIIKIGLIAIAVIAVIVVLVSGYVKASPDTAYIISGMRKKPKVLIGKAGIKIPFLEKKDELNLQLIPIDVKTANAVPTADYINIRVDAAVNVKISDKEELLARASQNFLNVKTDYIGGVAREVLEGNMREIVGKMNLEEMVSDRQKFAELVKENAEPDLAAMGLDIVSFNVQNFDDENGVIENLGVDNIVKIQKNAAISRAQSEKEIAVAQAKAQEEANAANAAAETKIAQANTDLAIRQSELQKQADSAKAEADAAYEIQRQMQQKAIETETVNASIAKAEREAELKTKEIAVKQQSLDAEIKKQADAERYRTEQNAEAEKNKKKLEAEAAKYAMEQEAAGIRAKGQAEADAIRAKAMAEADGMKEKAKAYSEYGQAAIAEMLISVLPEYARAVAEPLGNIDKISVITGGSDGAGNGVGTLADNVPMVMAKTIQSIKETTGFDLTKVMKGDTYDAKVNRNVNFNMDDNNLGNLLSSIEKAKASEMPTEKTQAFEPTDRFETNDEGLAEGYTHQQIEGLIEQESGENQ